MITAVSLAEINTDGKEATVLVHPKQVGIGQPFLVRLTSVQAFDKILVRWMDREFVPAVSQWNGHHVAIAMLGTDVLTIKPGRRKLLVRAWAGGNETVWQRSVLIVGRTYPRQALNLPSKMVTPPTVELERIKAERTRTQEAKTTWSDQRLWRLPFHRPVEGKYTSVYGLQTRAERQTQKSPPGSGFQGTDGNRCGSGGQTAGSFWLNPIIMPAIPCI